MPPTDMALHEEMRFYYYLCGFGLFSHRAISVALVPNSRCAYCYHRANGRKESTENARNDKIMDISDLYEYFCI